MRQIVASFLVGLLLIGNTPIAYASTVEGIKAKVETETAIASTDDLDSQLNDIYKQVGAELKIDYMYVKILHLLAGGKAIYADKRPNIYNEISVETMGGPFDIEGSTQEYELEAPWAFCPDPSVKRPSKYYVPDAAYSVTADIVKIMNNRYYADRGNMTAYFNALKKEVKTNILFNEAVMVYTGSKAEAVNSFYTIYEKILYDKSKDENVVQANTDGTYQIKDKFKEIFVDNGIKDEKELKRLAIILSFDSNLAISNNPDNVKDSYVLPYKIGYTSRENLMLAGSSLVGKVRYVWGGGHLTSGNIQGISPAWKEFFDNYGTKPGESGYNKCIEPSGNWCPIHKAYESPDACIFASAKVNSVEEYMEVNKGIMNQDVLTDPKFKTLIDTDVDFSKSVFAHRLDGLDCSGYTSWLYNQVDRTRTYDSGARWFIGDSGMMVIPFGSEMLPGDIFSWGDHIVVIVGAVKKGSKAYIMLEASPNMVKYGVLYYTGATQDDLREAKKIAVEANSLIGSIPTTEATHVDNMNAAKIEGGYGEIGRYANAFIDEDTILPDYNKKIKDMTAKEIIQHTINKLPTQFVNGLDSYTGKIFDISRLKDIKREVSAITKVNEIEKVKEAEDVKSDTVEKLVDIGTKTE